MLKLFSPMMSSLEVSLANIHECCGCRIPVLKGVGLCMTHIRVCLNADSHAISECHPQSPSLWCILQYMFSCLCCRHMSTGTP